MEFPVEKIEAMIYTIRGLRVMLDSDLAKLYGVETKRLKEQVKRNIDRFPQDFLIEPNLSDLADLRSQIATLGQLSSENYVFKHAPYLFTENGVAMLSSVLQSKDAIQVNISIMRTFTKLRSFLAMDSSMKEEVGQLKKNTNQLFKIVFERLDNLEDQVAPKLPANRKKIGLISDQKD
ncbi:MAG: ORF6N domain-containing protein [Bacteriovorax sp.]